MICFTRLDLLINIEDPAQSTRIKNHSKSWNHSVRLPAGQLPDYLPKIARLNIPI